MNEEVEEVGPTCLYKDGEAKIFNGAEVARMMEQGWLDHPQDVAEDGPNVEPEPEPEPAPEPEPVVDPVLEPQPQPDPQASTQPEPGTEPTGAANPAA